MVSVTPPTKVRELAVTLDAADALPAYAYDLAALDAHAAAIRAAKLPESLAERLQYGQ